MAKRSDTDLGTRERLLEAAGEVFAERGFRNATVRDICRRSRSNVAAVNYHFGDKEQLYAAVLQYADHCANQEAPTALALDDNLTAEQRLRAYVRSTLLRLCDEGRPAWHGKLMVWEMVEPTPAFDTLIEQSIRPRFELLVSIIQELLGSDVAPAEVRLCAMSMVAQWLYFHHVRRVITRLDPRQKYRSADIEALADHIARFSLAALKHLPREQEGTG